MTTGADLISTATKNGTKKNCPHYMNSSHKSGMVTLRSFPSCGIILRKVAAVMGIGGTRQTNCIHGSIFTFQDAIDLPGILLR